MGNTGIFKITSVRWSKGTLEKETACFGRAAISKYFRDKDGQVTGMEFETDTGAKFTQRIGVNSLVEKHCLKNAN